MRRRHPAGVPRQRWEPANTGPRGRPIPQVCAAEIVCRKDFIPSDGSYRARLEKTGSVVCRAATRRGGNDPVGLLPGAAHACIGGVARSFRFVEAPHLNLGEKVAGIVPVTVQSWQGRSVSCTLGSGMSTYGLTVGSRTFLSASMNMQSSRSSAESRTMLGVRAGEDVRCGGGVQHAMNRPTPEETAGTATGRDGRDDVWREYPDGFRQAEETRTAGGGQQRLKEEIGWLRAPTPPPPSRTVPRFGRRDQWLSASKCSGPRG